MRLGKVIFLFLPFLLGNKIPDEPTSSIEKFSNNDSTVILNVYSPATCLECYAIYYHLPRIYEQNPQLKVVYLFPNVRPYKQKEILKKIKFGSNCQAEYLFDTELYNSVLEQFNPQKTIDFLVKISPKGKSYAFQNIDHGDKSLTKRKDVVDFLLGNN